LSEVGFEPTPSERTRTLVHALLRRARLNALSLAP